MFVTVTTMQVFSLPLELILLVMGAAALGSVLGYGFLRKLLLRFTLQHKLQQQARVRAQQQRQLRVRVQSALFNDAAEELPAASTAAGQASAEHPAALLARCTAAERKFYATPLFTASVTALFAAYSGSHFFEQLCWLLCQNSQAERAYLFLRQAPPLGVTRHSTAVPLEQAMNTTLKLHSAASPQGKLSTAELALGQQTILPLFAETQLYLERLQPFVVQEKQGTVHTLAVFLPLFSWLPPPTIAAPAMPQLLGCIKLIQTLPLQAGGAHNLPGDDPVLYGQLLRFIARAYSTLTNFSGERTVGTYGFLTSGYLEVLLTFVLDVLRTSSLPPSLCLGKLGRLRLHQPAAMLRQSLTQLSTMLSNDLPPHVSLTVAMDAAAPQQLYVAAFTERAQQFLQENFIALCTRYLAAAQTPPPAFDFKLQRLDVQSFEEFKTFITTPS